MVYMSRKYGCEVTGLDTSSVGVEMTKKNLELSDVKGDVFLADGLSDTLPAFVFDVAGSWGLIEHFNNPLPLIEAQFRLVKPEGIAIFTMPNYAGIYGRIEKSLNPDNLDRHNLTYMDIHSLRSLLQHLPNKEILYCEKYGAGHLGLLGLHKLIGLPSSIVLKHMVGLGGIFQPIHIKALTSMVALVLRRV